MPFKMKNETFICENCHKSVSKHPEGSARNHCPYCLFSKHMDKDFPWDRKSECHWLMKPIWIDYKKNKWYMIIHECQTCHKKMKNKVAVDDHFIEFSKKLNASQNY